MTRKYRSKLDKFLPRRRILIFTEGKTERDYLRCFKSRLQTGIKIQAKHVSENKLALVKKVIKLTKREDLSKEDRTWVVLDRDEVAGDIRDREVFIEACNLAGENDIEIAYSNDAFELWPLLHFQEVQAGMSRKKLLDALNGHCDNRYQKKGRRIFDILRKTGGLPKAHQRAEQLIKMHERNGTAPADANPSTTLHRLIDVLKDSEN